MENESLPRDVWKNVTTSSSEDDDLSLYLANIRDLALKVVYIIIGTVGVLDNLFVIIVFISFIKITDKVLTTFDCCVLYSASGSVIQIKSNQVKFICKHKTQNM